MEGKIPRLRRIVGAEQVPTEKAVPKIVRVPANDPIIGTVVSDSIFELVTHYSQGFTRLCAGEEECEMCGLAPRRFYGLLAVWPRSATGPQWVQLTPKAVLHLMGEITERQIVLHGLNVKISRERKVKNAPITIAIDEWARTVSRLPKPLTPDETIERVFGSKKIPRFDPTKAV